MERAIRLCFIGKYRLIAFSQDQGRRNRPGGSGDIIEDRWILGEFTYPQDYRNPDGRIAYAVSRD